ncbi:MAG: hypothetical protein AAGK93_00130 [Pseudomonadota bacterium]
MSAAEKLLTSAKRARDLVRLMTAEHALSCPVSQDAASGPCNCGVLNAEERARLYWAMRSAGTQMELCV